LCNILDPQWLPYTCCNPIACVGLGQGWVKHLHSSQGEGQ